MKRYRPGFLLIIPALLLFFSCAGANEEPRNTISSDGTVIAYTVYSKGEPTLVFVHGWSCDSRYWRMQVAQFSKKYSVVTLDLAGHGHSGFKRKEYTMQAYAQDIKAVVEALGCRRVILIGHSMAGEIVCEAALLMPERVIGIIGVDTLQNVEYTLDSAILDKEIKGLQDDFSAKMSSSFREMISPSMPRALADWIVNDVCQAPPEVAISTFREVMGLYISGRVKEPFHRLKIPVRCINADLWPTDVEANRRHMASFEVRIMKGAGHFLMLERPAEFNRLLEETIQEILHRK